MIKIKKKKGDWDLPNSTELDDLAYNLYCYDTKIKSKDIQYSNNGYFIILLSQSQFINDEKRLMYYDKAKIILRKYKINKLKKKKRWTLLQWIRN